MHKVKIIGGVFLKKKDFIHWIAEKHKLVMKVTFIFGEKIIFTMLHQIIFTAKSHTF